MSAVPSQRGKHVVITGATNGIGLEAAVILARAGAGVTIVGRDPARTQAVAASIRQRAGSQAVDHAIGDFAVQASVRALAADLLARFPRIDVLVNNAGTVNAERLLTVDGIEATFAVNHLGYYLLTELLLPRLRESAPARIVNVSSRGHYRGTLDFDDLGFERESYFIMKAYSRSKLCNVLYTRSLGRRLAGSGVTANCLHPGGVATNIWSGAPKWSAPLMWLLQFFLRTAEQGAEPIVRLATSPEVEGKSGLYLHESRFRTPSKLALDDALGDRLEAVSARMVGLTPAEVTPAC